MQADQAPPPRPWWLAVSLLAALAALGVALGFWQLERAGQSRAAGTRLAAALERPPIGALAPGSSNEALRYRRAALAGRYVPQQQFLVDHIVRDGRVGYYVLTPFAMDDGGPWLIVNRGWVAADPDRAVLPDVAVGAGHRRVAGVLDALPSPGLRLGEGHGNGDEPLAVLSYPTMTELERRLGRPLFGYQLLLGEDEPDGFRRDFPAPRLRPERHLAYAVQWWLLAAFAAGAALAVGWRSLGRRAR